MQIFSCYRVMQSLEFSRSYMFYLYLFPSVYIISSRYRYIDCIYIITSYHSVYLYSPSLYSHCHRSPSLHLFTPYFCSSLFLLISISISLFPPLALSLALSLSALCIFPVTVETQQCYTTVFWVYSVHGRHQQCSATSYWHMMPL